MPKGPTKQSRAARSAQAALDCFAPLAMTRSAAGRRNIAMSKSEEKLPPKEWQARHDAACAIVARKYCDIFGFWRDCRYKPCRAARRCSGDQGACLQSRWQSIPYDAGIAARERVFLDTPADADRFARMAHNYAHYSSCLHDSKNQKKYAKTLKAKT
jgi:hypothetical protein